MKKSLSLMLVILFLFSLGFPYGVVAEEEKHVEGTRDHEHSIIVSTIVTVRDGWTPYNYLYHVYRYRNTGTCSTCGQTVTWYTKGDYSTRADHVNPTQISATCNGTFQTLTYTCTACGQYQRIKRCPAGPHTGPCPLIPYD